MFRNWPEGRTFYTALKTKHLLHTAAYTLEHKQINCGNSEQHIPQKQFTCSSDDLQQQDCSGTRTPVQLKPSVLGGSAAILLHCPCTQLHVQSSSIPQRRGKTPGTHSLGGMLAPESLPGTPTFCLPTHGALWFVGYTFCSSLSQEEFGMRFVGAGQLFIPELNC